MNITSKHPGYWELLGKLPKSARNNGALYYAREIEKNIIPRVKTDREWNTVGRDLDGMHDGMIVFLHDNNTPWHYEWLKKYKNLVLICSSRYTADSVKYSGHVVFLPMSIDTEYVKRFLARKTRDICFVGNSWVKKNLRIKIDKNVDCLTGMPREELLEKLARFQYAYAIDRCALEAKALHCKLLPTPTRYGCDVDYDWDSKVLDNREAARILQDKLNIIDGGLIFRMGTADYRTVEKNGNYLIQERDDGEEKWTTIGEFSSADDARKMVEDLRANKCI